MDVESNGQKLLNVKETAQRLRVHENTVRNWARTGLLRSAQVPGARFLRFYAEDVERLARKRGNRVAPVGGERRTIGPELVDATQLSQWAGTKEAQHRFPELMRRLLASTPGVTNIAVRAGEGVSAPGWDGLADSEGASYLPKGTLCFEFGVGANPRAKAEKDYQKRASDPAGVVPSESTFIFATLHRWAGASEWTSEKRADGIFGDIRVIDADDLEGWLQQTPAVHQWISEQLGRHPRYVETLEQWWSRFQSRTKPALPGALFLAGRGDESKRLADFLRERPEVVAVQSAWRDDAIAFVCATIQEMKRKDQISQPALLVSSEEVWDRVVAQPGRMTLLPMFDGADLATAIDHGHYVVVPLGWEQVVRGEHIHLPRPGREGSAKALETALSNAEMDSDAAYRLAAQARRSMPALIRRLARDPAFARPQWCKLPDALTFAPLVLLGSWEDTEDDLEIVSRIVDEPWQKIERDLLHWRLMDDPPFVHPGSQWHLASADEAFLLLKDNLTASDLSKWHKVVLDVLLEKDPKLELEPNDRPMAGLKGAVRKYSSVLRLGLAQGIALLGTTTDTDAFVDGVTGRDHARRAVDEILSRANDDETGQTWCSLSAELRLLAEGSPEAFLDAVHADLDRDDPVLRKTFQDGEQTSALFSSSPHTGLLWALEVLCWSPDYLLDAARALARLAEIDPGGQLSNRPLASLSSVLVGWIRHTAAPLNTKIAALQQIGEKNRSDIAWDLILELWPSDHAISSPPASPRFEDWKPESRGVLASDWIQFISSLVELAIALAGADAKRWASLSEHLGPLPPEERDRILIALDRFADPAVLMAEDRLELWERIDREVARHRQFPDTDWSLDESVLSRMQSIADKIVPTSDVARFAYLFDWHPDLPGLEAGDESYDKKLAELRVEAVRKTLDSASIEGLQRLAERSAAPSQLGWIVGKSAPDELTESLLRWLDADSDALRETANSWAAQKLGDRQHGVRWLLALIKHPEATSLERRTALALAAPATRELWDALRAVDSDLADAYWSSMRPWRIDETDIPYAGQELLRQGRPWTALDMLTFAVHGKKKESGAVAIELAEKVLDAALASDEEITSQSPGYEVGVLLDYLDAHSYPPDRLARYEFAFLPILESSRHRPKALYSELAADSSLFVDLVSRLYRGKSEPRRKLNRHDEALAHHAWLVLHNWRSLPGLQDDGSIDGGHLKEWVRTARLAFAESDRADIGDEQIGTVLAASPEGTDGIWPAEPVREIVDEIGSMSLETGIHVGRVNRRGVTSRGVYDGGRQERELADQYRKWAKGVASRWPRTSRVLRSLADTYERDARHHDSRAEITADIE